MQSVLDNCQDKMKKCVLSLETEYQNMRTGRANASLFDKIKVDYYGSETPLNQVASISVPEARLVVIQPWDKSILSAIEKAASGSPYTKPISVALKPLLPPLEQQIPKTKSKHITLD